MDPVQLLSTVNSFYDQAFNKLMVVTFGIIAFIGVLVPLVVGWVQTRTLRAEKNSLLTDLKAEIESERDAVRQAIESSVREEVNEVRLALEQRIEELTRNLDEASASAEARSFHLQGRDYVKSNKSTLGVKSFAHAATRYIDARDESNAQRCINSLIEDCLPKTDKSKYKKFKVERVCGDLLAKLRDCNENGRYSNFIQRIESEMEYASSREAEPAAALGST